VVFPVKVIKFILIVGLSAIVFVDALIVALATIRTTDMELNAVKLKLKEVLGLPVMHQRDFLKTTQ
jgi:hypothetical protein